MLHFCTRKKTLKKGVERLLFLLRLNLTINCLILSTSIVTNAQSNCSIKLSVVTEPSYCQADGKIVCTLSDTSGSELEQVKYFYIAKDGLDSIIETSLSSLDQFRPGWYKVKVAALCRTGLGHGEEYVIVSDSVDDVYVVDLYTIPTCGAVYNIFNKANPYGIIPSFACQPTGQAQLKIQNGHFPYTVDIWKIDGSDTNFIRSVTFSNYQHWGSSNKKQDYVYYYTIDSLAVGNYKMICHDGCGYYTPPVIIEIPEIQSGISEQAHLLKNSSDIFTSNNIITFKELLDMNLLAPHNDDYYHFYDTTLGPLIQYRFINPTKSESKDTSQWYALPLRTDGYLIMHDTLSQLADYGSVWFKEVILQFKPTYCSDLSWTYHFTIYPHQNFWHYTYEEVANEIREESYYDLCGHHIGGWQYDIRTRSYLYEISWANCNNSDSLNCSNAYFYTAVGGIPNDNVGCSYHYYYTLPIKCKVTNVSADTVVCYKTMSYFDYRWKAEYISDRNLAGDTIIVEIMDANDCPILSVEKILYFPSQHRGQPTVHSYHLWKSRSEIEGYCSNSIRKIGLFESRFPVPLTFTDSSGVKNHMYYGDTIRIIESPNGNYYNFMAYADRAEHFHIIKENSSNLTEISYGTYDTLSQTYPAIYVKAAGLPSGRYVWTITSACDHPADTIVQIVQFPKEPAIIEKPVYEFQPGCTRLEIEPTAGQYNLEGQNLTTYFQVHRPGELSHSANSVLKNETMSVGIPGAYIISMYALPNNQPDLLVESPCYITDTVIQWDGHTVEFEYVESYVCNSADDIGFVHARGKNGELPYLYKVYSLPDLGGTILGQNTIGDFEALPIHAHQDLSVEITDACEAHFHTNFKVTDMESIRKCWVEDHLYGATFHEGDSCHLYSISLEGAHYHWTGPDGFEQHTQNCVFYIPLGGHKAGIYHLEITNVGCGLLKDSLIINVLDGNYCPEAVDFDGNHYASIRIDGLCWTTQNLKSEHYGDGRKIQEVMSYYSDLFQDSTANVNRYGHLYTWYAATDTSQGKLFTPGGHTQGICPNGWYLPEPQQYERLMLHGAHALRSPHYWLYNLGGENSTGFSALPAGFYNGDTKRFENLLGETRFWANSSENFDKKTLAYLFLIQCAEASEAFYSLGNGHSIRCILEE